MEATQDSPAHRLSRVFPGATAMKIPIRMMREGGFPPEKTTIEFGTAREVIFRTQSDLEFDEYIRLRNDDGSFDAEVRVIAVQWDESTHAVAARFTTPANNWIIKP
jgi:hypothetical protein